MKRLKLLTTLSLFLTAISVGVASFNLFKLYSYEKENTLKTVKECAENAILLEMIGRMEKSEGASQSFIRLNAFLEFAQQKDGRIAKADSLRTSLASILSFGLDFPDNKSKTDLNALDSIFREELARHNLYPKFSSILPIGTSLPNNAELWETQYSQSPSGDPIFDIYVSQMPGKVLSRMWGIIIPFSAVIVLFSFLSFYLIRTISKMRTMEQMKDDFAHNMTHELKTPVAVAYSAADSMLRYYDQSDEIRNRQFLKIIMQRLSHLSGMIENILSMSMERFKTMKLNIERIKLKPLAEEAAGMIELKATKPVKIKIDIPENLSIPADSLHLGNVLSNLLDNAVKYSGESLEINIKADSSIIEVTDNGIGIKKEDIPFIFDKFYRVSSGDRYEAPGYGLGLFYVKQIVEMHGWRIDVASKTGQGTKFTIKYRSNEER
ncbi:MAG: HAMP domain-containing histidine kinase [Muribaculaceae bacterium]|nr:HAMP domain-containing histidine kinase [Muribaculaceae bacterium]